MPAPESPAEFRLIAAACRWPPGDDRDQAVRVAAHGVADWEAVLRGAARHRVEGHLHQALVAASVRAPEAVRKTLAARALGVARQNLANAAEEARLQQVFAGAGIAACFVKGATLGALAYGSQSIKTARDIDVLVPEPALDQVCEILSGLGYVRRSPSPELAPDAHRKYVSVFKESAWVHPVTGLVIEAHVGLARNPRLIPGVGLASPMQSVNLAPGVSASTLEREALFAYLAVHGALHVWKRLKWLADVAALVGREPCEAERLHDAAVDLGAGRCPAAALLLCHDALGLPLEADFLRRLRADRGAVWLAALGLRFLADNGRDPDFDNRPGALIAIFISKFRLAPGWRYKVAEALDQLRTPPREEAVDWPVWARLAGRLAALGPRWAAGFRRTSPSQA